MASFFYITLVFSMLAAGILSQGDYNPAPVTVTHTTTLTLESCGVETSSSPTTKTTTTIRSTTVRTITVHTTRHPTSTSDDSITPFTPPVPGKPTPKPSIISLHNVTLTRQSTLPAFTTCTDPECRPYQLPTPDISHSMSSCHHHHSSGANGTLPASTSSHFLGSTVTVPCFTQSTSHALPSFKTSTSSAPSTSMTASPVTTNDGHPAPGSSPVLLVLGMCGLVAATLML